MWFEQKSDSLLRKAALLDQNQPLVENILLILEQVRGRFLGRVLMPQEGVLFERRFSSCFSWSLVRR